ncbi:MAG: T9SS type A sorting domain-containing protein [Bacteroidota bacterium]
MVNVRDFAQLDGLRIYPNPASEQIGLEYDLPTASHVSVSLFDGLGRRVMTRNFGRRIADNNFDRLDVREFPVGTYHLQVMVDGAPVRAQTILKR